MKKLFKKLENKLSVFNNQSQQLICFCFLYFNSIQIILSKLNKIILPTQNISFECQKGSFSNKWFDNNISLFFIFFKNEKFILENKNSELGSWEGRSSLFIISFSKNFFLTCVDTWEGVMNTKIIKT